MNTTNNNEMTKEEILEFLKNRKIRCASEQESIDVQKKLFDLGIKWISNFRPDVEKFYLFYINEQNQLTRGVIYKYWVDDDRKELSVQELLSIQIKEEQKPKFNPNTLQPFDKVLVRDDDTCKWGISFFDIYEYELGHFCCIEDTYYQCVPYNEETKHLHRTNNEAPEFYQIWK
jgi:hypothetical protein